MSHASPGKFQVAFYFDVWYDGCVQIGHNGGDDMHGAYILARYSTDRQNEDSIEVQVERCSAWCQQQGIPVLDIFADMAVSGMKETRPQYARMMQQLEQGGADTVVIYDQSRMFRKMTSWFLFREQMENMGIGVVSVTQPTVGGDLNEPSNFIQEGATALVNQMWALQTRQKVVAKMRYMANNGQHTGGVPALGYRVTDGKLEVDPDEAETVRMIFAMYAAGSSYREIIAELNRRGMTTKTGKPFGSNSLHDLLKNEKYIGILVYGKTRKRPDGKRNTHGAAKPGYIRKENGCPAIIDNETFAAVQKRLAENRRKGGRPVERQAQPLKGKVFCGECKAAMNISYSGSTKPKRYAYYDCTAKHRLHNCDAAPIQKDALEKTVADGVRDMLSQSDSRKKLLKVIREACGKIQAEAGPKMAKMVRDLSAIEKKLDNATEAVLSGLNSQALRDKIAQLEEDRDRLSHDIDIYHAQVQHTTIADDQMEYLLQKALEVGGADDEAILSIVVRVEVYKDSIAIWTIIDGPPEKPTGKISKETVALVLPAPPDGAAPEYFAHNSTSRATGTINYAQNQLIMAILMPRLKR